MLNALTIDIEDYFQVQAFSDVIRFEDWDKYESRVERNTHRLLEILNECIGPNNSINSMNSTNSSNSINPSNPSAALQHGSTAARQHSSTLLAKSNLLHSGLDRRAISQSHPKNQRPWSRNRLSWLCA
jgi:hypothetical protein